MTDLMLVAGFVVLVGGVWLNWGPGWACIVAGSVLFVAAGLHSRREP